MFPCCQSSDLESRVTFSRQMSKIKFSRSFQYRGGLMYSESKISDVQLNYVLDSNTLLILKKHVILPLFEHPSFSRHTSSELFFFRPSENTTKPFAFSLLWCRASVSVLCYPSSVCLCEPLPAWLQEGDSSCDWDLKISSPENMGQRSVHGVLQKSCVLLPRQAPENFRRRFLFCLHETTVKGGVRIWNTRVSILPLDSLILLLIKKSSVMPYIPQAILDSKAFIKSVQTKEFSGKQE